MADHHSIRERVQLFGMGWRRGASMKAIPDNPPGLKDDPDFQNGYREGRIAYASAMEIARKHYGAEPPSALRITETLAIVKSRRARAENAVSNENGASDKDMNEED